MKRYFTSQEGGANKFWNIAYGSVSIELHYGRIGTAGQRLHKLMATPELCLKEVSKLVAEKLRKGYTELATPADLPAPATRPVAPAARLVLPDAPAEPTLRLRPGLVAGQRVGLSAAFTKYQLGGKQAIKQLLLAHEATVIGHGSEQPLDFYLGGYQLEGATHAFNAPVRFEDEVCEPLPGMDEGPFGGLRRRVLTMVSELLTHPNVAVQVLSVGKPLSDADFARYEKKLRRPLPAYLKDLYRQVGELRLLWYYRIPSQDQRVFGAGSAWNRDANDNHDGAINIFPLREVLFGDWFNPQYAFSLADNQRMFDMYSGYYMMAVELGEEDDPLVHLGNDYGVSFDDDKPLRLSDYMSLLLHSYGAKGRERLFGADLGGRFRADDETQLQGLARLEGPNPFGIELGNYDKINNLPDLRATLLNYQRYGAEERYFRQLEAAVQHQGFARAVYEDLRAALTHYPRLRPELYDTPRFQAIIDAAPRLDVTPGEIETKVLYREYNGAQRTFRATVRLQNHAGMPCELLGYHVTATAAFATTSTRYKAHSVLMREFDTIEQAQHFWYNEENQLRYRSATQGEQPAYYSLPEFPVAIGGRDQGYAEVFLYDVDKAGLLASYGISGVRHPDFHSLTVDVKLELRLRQNGQARTLTVEMPMDTSVY